MYIDIAFMHQSNDGKLLTITFDSDGTTCIIDIFSNAHIWNVESHFDGEITPLPPDSVAVLGIENLISVALGP